jgi:hypothetical protein
VPPLLDESAIFRITGAPSAARYSSVLSDLERYLVAAVPLTVAGPTFAMSELDELPSSDSIWLTKASLSKDLVSSEKRWSLVGTFTHFPWNSATAAAPPCCCHSESGALKYTDCPPGLISSIVTPSSTIEPAAWCGPKWMSNRIGLPLLVALPTMWNDVAAFIACCTLALRSAVEVLDPPPDALDPLDPLDPLDGEPFVLELQAAIIVAPAIAAATPRYFRTFAMPANSNRCPVRDFSSGTAEHSGGPDRRRPGRSPR